jgi:hypothetical protein
MSRIILGCAAEARLNVAVRTRLGRYASACGAETALQRALPGLPRMLADEAREAIQEMRALAAHLP